MSIKKPPFSIGFKDEFDFLSPTARLLLQSPERSRDAYGGAGSGPDSPASGLGEGGTGASAYGGIGGSSGGAYGGGFGAVGTGPFASPSINAGAAPFGPQATPFGGAGGGPSGTIAQKPPPENWSGVQGLEPKTPPPYGPGTGSGNEQPPLETIWGRQIAARTGPTRTIFGGFNAPGLQSDVGIINKSGGAGNSDPYEEGNSAGTYLGGRGQKHRKHKKKGNANSGSHSSHVRGQYGPF